MSYNQVVRKDKTKASKKEGGGAKCIRGTRAHDKLQGHLLNQRSNISKINSNF